MALKNIDYSRQVGATSTLLLSVNPQRIGVTFVNDSDETIYIMKGHDAVANRGIRLNANGGSYEIGYMNPWPGLVYGICASGGKVLCISEDSAV